MVAAKQSNDFEVVNFSLLKDVFFDRVDECDGYVVGSNERLKDSLYNYAGAINIPESRVASFIQGIEKDFQQKMKTPCVYLTPDSSPSLLEHHMFENGWILEYQDAWMFFESVISKEDQSNADMRQVDSEQMMREYARLFMKAHEGTPTPENPYAGISPDYGDLLVESFVNPHTSTKLEYWLGWRGGEPVCYGGIVNIGQNGQLFAIGTHPDHRRKGYGSQMTTFLTQRIQGRKVLIPYLITEVGSYNETLYSKLGYKTRFIGKAYTKKLL